MTKKEVINHLKTILISEQFIVTGSYALSKMGLVEESKVGDLDIILVKPIESTLEVLKRLQEEHPAKTKMYADGYIFLIDNIKVDIFCKQDKINTELIVDNIYIATVDHIVREKKICNRLKDWKQLRKIAKLICSREEIERFLNAE
jgi:hypothetical protein